MPEVVFWCEHSTTGLYSSFVRAYRGTRLIHLCLLPDDVHAFLVDSQLVFRSFSSRGFDGVPTWFEWKDDR